MKHKIVQFDELIEEMKIHNALMKQLISIELNKLNKSFFQVNLENRIIKENEE
jgi:hypothetical protein